MKKLFVFSILFIILTGFLTEADFGLAEEEKIEIYFFYGATCPHCSDEKIFLEKLEVKFSELKIHKLLAPDDLELLKKKYEDYEVPQEVWGLVPITFIEDRYFLGYGGDETTGKEIENYILELKGKSEPEPEEPVKEEVSNEIKIPLLGEIDISNFSPLALAVVLGALDGFNACAMVALGFLLAVLISTRIRKRVFLIGGIFILVSGVVYFLFISAWLNLFLCLANLKIITLVVGIIVSVFALFLLKDYFTGVVCRICKVTPGKEGISARFQRKLFEKMEKFSAAETPLLLSLLGVVVVAVGINMVELCCSFGFPLVFTKILTSFELPTISYYFYLLVYIIFYMIDDFLIFLIAVLTLRITKASEKYLKFIKVISGLLLLILGLILLIKPELLAFG